MAKYLLKRLLHGAISIIIVIGIVMLLVYSLMNRNAIFANDPTYAHKQNNEIEKYKYETWEEYGYLDYVSYADYLKDLDRKGELDVDYSAVSKIGKTADKDTKKVSEYVEKFTNYYESKGYTVVRVDAKLQGKRGKVAPGGDPLLYAYKNTPVLKRLGKYLAGLVHFDNIHAVKDDAVGERGIKFYAKDPAGDGSFSPCVIGNGTTHKYLIYTDSKFPYIHQNMISLNLGTSFTVNRGIEMTDTMTRSQGEYILSTITYPTGLTEQSADDLHTAEYAAGSLENNKIYKERFTDNYTNTKLVRGGKSRIGYSFTIGIIEVIISYLLGLPIGVLMARKKDKFADKLGTAFIIFIIAVPSLAYIFLFKAIGNAMKLPTQFDINNMRTLMYVLPIVSLAMPTIAGIMKWMRRFMIDQMSADYVKFARSGGLSEKEIFSKHIMKNAAVPIMHDIPGSILFSMTGAIITERVYSVPGIGNLLTEAIGKYDNGVIIGVTLFYAVLTVLSMIFGDILMAAVDPRISFTTKSR